MKTIAFSTKHRRPGCAIIQRLFGATISDAELELGFGSETWLVGGEPGFRIDEDIQVFAVTDEQLRQLTVMAKQAIATKRKR